MAERQLKLGIFLQGGGGHWKDPNVRANGAANIDAYIESARTTRIAVPIQPSPA